MTKRNKKVKDEDEDDAFKSAGRITTSGEKSIRFWVRTLDLEKEVEQASAQILAKLPSPEMRGTMPIIGEYKVSENFEFIYFIMITMDGLGVIDGNAVIYYTDPERRAIALKARDNLADHMFKEIHKHPGMKVELKVMEDKKYE
jgi:hypothetical protein